MTPFRENAGLLAVAVIAVLITGCSSSNSGSGSVSGSSQHPADWISMHGDAILAGNSDYCTSCHGLDFGGGSVGVACADCHGSDAAILAPNPALAALVFGADAGSPSIDHPADFDSLTVTDDTIPFYTFDAARHGYIAKAYFDEAPVGFDFCAECHTDNFTGKPLPTPPFPGPSANCLACHGNETPHSPDLAEWAEYHHITTRPENADVCALCHADGNNSPLPPPTPDLSIANRCFNGTLCHTGSIVTTPIVDHYENHWDFHQRNPEACRICHGDDFQGQGEAPACFSCHNNDTAPLCTICHDPATFSLARKKAQRR